VKEHDEFCECGCNALVEPSQVVATVRAFRKSLAAFVGGSTKVTAPAIVAQAQAMLDTALFPISTGMVQLHGPDGWKTTVTIDPVDPTMYHVTTELPSGPYHDVLIGLDAPYHFRKPDEDDHVRGC
jgi:hypothetical protein